MNKIVPLKSQTQGDVVADLQNGLRLLLDKGRSWLSRRRAPEFDRNLRRLVSHPDWKTMLKYNPIRSEHEMKWYLESRFPGRRIETLNLAWNSRIVAFDSGPVETGIEANLTYP